MQLLPLGKTGIFVSKLAIGSLTVGPLQADLSPARGGEILSYAFDAGINHVDTAQLYETYPHVKEGLARCKHPENVVISSKTYAYTRQMAIDAVDEARRLTGRDMIDIFLLHEQESEHTIRGHMEALEELYRLKAAGVLRAVGISTHRIAGVQGAVKYNLDVVHPLLNKFGVGIGDGTAAEMLAAVQQADQAGLGIFLMKAFGGGNLLAHTAECLDFMRGLPWSFACGMQSEDEINADICYVEKGYFPLDEAERLKKVRRRLLIEEHCIGCGACERRCAQGAVKVIDGKAQVDPEKCITCGYCGRVCPETAMKII